MSPTDAQRWIETAPTTPLPTPDAPADLRAWRNADGDYYCVTCVGRLKAVKANVGQLIAIPEKSPTWRSIRRVLWCDCCQKKFDS